MRNKLILLTILSSFIFMMAGFRSVEENKTAKKITSQFLSDKKILSSKIEELSAAFNDSAALYTKKELLKSRLLACRIAYKKIEWIIAYYYPAVATRVNGTDVIDEEEPTEFEPAHGLQVLEDCLFAEDTIPFMKLKKETSRLINNIKLLDEASGLLSGSSTDEILSALKYEIIKVSAIGFTEYDNPVEKNYLTESAVALEGVRENLKLTLPDTETDLRSHIDLIFTKATAYIRKNNNTETFNRMEFLTTYFPSLCKITDTCTAALHLDYKSYNRNVNLKSASIFDLQSFENFTGTEKNPAHDARVLLGKNLFFDPVLSGNMQRACASCHNPSKGFTDGLPRSIAFDPHQTVTRSSPTLLNVCLQTSFFDDSRVAMLETQAAAVINNPKELNSNFSLILSRLKKSDQYKQLFQNAFPGDTITSMNILKALSDYERTLVSFNSDFDKYLRGEKNKLGKSEINGFNLFMGKAKCGSCHFLPLFNGMIPPLYNKSEFEIIGIVKSNDFKHPELDSDEGVGPLKKADHLKFGFKVPSLRNIAITAPYMHNGSLKNLDEVLAFYNTGGGAGLKLSVPNQTLSSDSLHLTKKEIKDIVHFLKSLTDSAGLTSRPSRLPEIVGMERKAGGVY